MPLSAKGVKFSPLKKKDAVSVGLAKRKTTPTTFIGKKK